MGIILLTVAVTVEVALATYSIVSKSNQHRLRGLVRVGAFAAFVLATLLSVVEWSMRYMPLGAVLLVLAATGTSSLLKKTDDKEAYSAKRTVWGALLTALVFLIATVPPVFFPPYEPFAGTGEYRVATATYSLLDTSRIETYAGTGEHRKVNVKFWYPEKPDATYPLIVLSHGALGVKSSNESLCNELASNGYVVVAIDHTYQCLYTTDENGHTVLLDIGYMRELSTENARSNRMQSYDYYRKWMAVRTGDMIFVLDHILAEAENLDADPVYTLVDTARIGVMGHSLGGSAALGLGRLRDDVGAVVALESPFMCDIRGVEDGEFVFTDEAYPAPVLNVYSDSSWSILGNRPQYAENYSLLSNATANAFSVHFSGIGHFALTDLALASPSLTRILDGTRATADAVYCLHAVNRICLTFFDSYLKGKGKFVPDAVYSCSVN